VRLNNDVMCQSSAVGAARDLLTITWLGGGTCIDDLSAATHLVIAPSELKLGADGKRHVPSHMRVRRPLLLTPACNLVVTANSVLRNLAPPSGCKTVTGEWLRASQLVSTDRYTVHVADVAGVRGFMHTPMSTAVYQCCKHPLRRRQQSGKCQGCTCTGVRVSTAACVRSLLTSSACRRLLQQFPAYRQVCPLAF
jgi:hypothetical protein